jgi:hypothetical protein
MNVSRIVYRSRQFLEALFSAPLADDLGMVSDLLNPAQMALFRQMHRSEQAHSIRVMRAVLSNCEGSGKTYQHDLLVAALLHDAGKSCYPLHIWERVLIVLGKRFFHGAVRKLGSREPVGWWRAFVVSEHHARWGAELAARAGASRLTVDMIRRHQDRPSGRGKAVEDRLLSIMQSADQEL